MCDGGPAALEVSSTLWEIVLGVRVGNHYLRRPHGAYWHHRAFS